MIYLIILEISIDFKNKIVMDVSSGSGILAIFSSLGGSRKVYAIEASDAIWYADVWIRYHIVN